MLSVSGYITLSPMLPCGLLSSANAGMAKIAAMAMRNANTFFIVVDVYWFGYDKYF